MGMWRARALSASLGEIGGRLAAEELMLCLFWEKITNLSHFEVPCQDVVHLWCDDFAIMSSVHETKR